MAVPGESEFDYATARLCRPKHVVSRSMPLTSIGETKHIVGLCGVDQIADMHDKASRRVGQVLRKLCRSRS